MTSQSNDSVHAQMRQIETGQTGGVARVEQTDLTTGDITELFVKLAGAGDATATLRVPAQPDAMDLAIRDAITGDHPALQVGLDPQTGQISAQTPAWQSAMRGLNAASTGPMSHFAFWDQRLCAVCGDGPDAKIVCAQDDGQVHEIAASALRLGGRRALTHMQALGPRLILAVGDAVEGFGLFALSHADGALTLTDIADRGAFRFSLNALISAACQTDAGLLLGTAALGTPRGAVGHWGPELILISADGTWDLVMGQPRFSPQGLKLPASALTPGFGLPGNAAIQAIAQGMWQGHVQTFVAVQGFAGSPPANRDDLRPELLEYHGAVQLFVSADLQDWAEVPHRLPADIGCISALGVGADALLVGHEGFGPHTVPLSHVPLP